MGNLIAKIVLTGGPCAGKTTTITKISEHLTEMGYHVMILNECSTELIKGGIRPFGDYASSVYDFENEILNLQIYKEKRYKNFLDHYPDDCKIVILYDRGCVDINAYLSDEEYKKILEENHLSNTDLINEYDLVLHMVTVAADMENRYSNSNNTARFEDPEGAVNVDKKIALAWKTHPNLIVVPVCETLEEKIGIAISHVDKLLKEKDYN